MHRRGSVTRNPILRLIAKPLLALGLLLPASGVLADETIAQTIARIQYNAEADYLYFVGPAAWGAASCPNATYVMVAANTVGRKQMLALGAAAKVSASQVSFVGTCADANYFNAIYIIVR